MLLASTSLPSRRATIFPPLIKGHRRLAVSAFRPHGILRITVAGLERGGFEIRPRLKRYMQALLMGRCVVRDQIPGWIVADLRTSSL